MSKNAAEHLKIKWHFLPSTSLHFFGHTDAGVKSIETHLYQVIGGQKLTYEDLNNVLVEIETLLNSQPILVQ